MYNIPMRVHTFVYTQMWVIIYTDAFFSTVRILQDEVEHLSPPRSHTVLPGMFL